MRRSYANECAGTFPPTRHNANCRKCLDALCPPTYPFSPARGGPDGSHSLRMRCLKSPHHYPSDQVRDRSWGFLACRKAAEVRRHGDIGSPVENRDGAADSENIDRVAIVLWGSFRKCRVLSTTPERAAQYSSRRPTGQYRVFTPPAEQSLGRYAWRGARGKTLPQLPTSSTPTAAAIVTGWLGPMPNSIAANTRRSATHPSVPSATPAAANVNGRKVYIAGQSLPDLVWWHGESFENRHDSFCTINTATARVFCDTWPRHFWSPPDASFWAVSGKSDSNEKKNEAVSIGS
jgi:hypothetical protein